MERDSPPEAPIDLLFEELMLEIFSWLSDAQLRNCALVNSNWHRLSSDDELWKSLCRSLWEDKLFFVNLHRVKELPLYRLLSWKETYKKSLEDSKRTIITMEELCAIKWKFYFRHAHFSMLSSYLSFTPDYHLQMESRKMSWGWTETNGIQVEHYPELKVERRKRDWGWRLKNQFVIFDSVDEELQATKKKKTTVKKMKKKKVSTKRKREDTETKEEEEDEEEGRKKREVSGEEGVVVEEEEEEGGEEEEEIEEEVEEEEEGVSDSEEEGFSGGIAFIQMQDGHILYLYYD